MYAFQINNNQKKKKSGVLSVSTMSLTTLLL